MSDKINKYIDFVKKNYILIMFIVGIILILLSYLPSKTEITSNSFSESEYIRTLEQKISGIVSMIDGAGDSAVIINISSTTESVYMKENKKFFDNDDTKTKSETEDSIITMKDKSGNEYALVTKQLMPKISGVTVVCDGGNDIDVKNSVINAVSTLLGIGANNVCVIAKAN